MGTPADDMTEEKKQETQGDAVEAMTSKPENNTIQFVFGGPGIPEPLLTIKADGTVIASDKLKPTEIAKQVLQAIEDVCKENGGLYKNKIYSDFAEKAKALMLVGDLEGAEETLDTLIKTLG